MRNCSRRSKPEPRNGLKSCPRSTRGVRSARCFAQISNPPSNTWIEGSEVAKLRNRRLRPAILRSEVREILGHWRARAWLQ
eukprot:13223757-Alexandrium_andersonii.AAC.1